MENPNYFIDPGADDEEFVKDIKQAHVREWHDEIERLRSNRICETIDDADGCPEYMRLHADWSRLRKQEGRIYRLIDKMTDILAMTQETTLGIECWQKIQNIEATAANAIAVDLNILEGEGCLVHGDRERLLWEKNVLAKALDNCIIVLKNRDRSENEQRVYDFARGILDAVTSEAPGPPTVNAEHHDPQ